MIIHIYSFIFFYSYSVLIERIVDLCFSLDYVLETQKPRPSWRNQFAAHLLILRADSPAGVLTVIRRVVSPFFTTKQTSVEISIVNFSFTILSSQGFLNRSFLAPTGCFVRGPEFEVVLRRRVGESVYARKTRTYMILSLISMGILKTSSSVLRLGDGRRKGFKHPKRRSKKFFRWSLWGNK